MLKMHMKTHAERSLQCDYCKKAFQTEYHLGLHLVKHNNKTAESFKCDPCNQSFISSNDLRVSAQGRLQQVAREMRRKKDKRPGRIMELFY